MDTVHIEPSHERRPHFALWCLSQVPQIQTASATGYDVPLTLYPDVPAELLEGAVVDGYRLDRPRVAATAPAPAGDPFAAVVGAPAPKAPRKPRKQAAPRAGRRTRKAAAPQPPVPLEVQADGSTFWDPGSGAPDDVVVTLTGWGDQ